MKVLLIADILDGELSLDQTAKALTAARAIGEVTILCASSNCSRAAKTLSTLQGITQVLQLDDEIYSKGLAETMATLISTLAKDYTHIMAAATAIGKNIMPRVAALLDVMVISDVSEMISRTLLHNLSTRGWSSFRCQSDMGALTFVFFFCTSPKLTI